MQATYSDHRMAQSRVRQQGERPTCVGFAVAGSQEWHGDIEEERSVEDVLWAAHRVGSPPHHESTSVQLALTGLNRYGHATELAWPYGQPAWPADRPALAANPANQRISANWYRLDVLQFDDLTRLLSDGLAVVLTVRFVPLAWRNVHGTIDSPAQAKIAGGHAVLAVGSTERDGSDCLIVKNSWGMWWGEAGYGFMTRTYVADYGVVAHVIGAQS